MKQRAGEGRKPAQLKEEKRKTSFSMRNDRWMDEKRRQNST